MLARVRTGVVRGVDAVAVHVEVHIASGLPTFTLVGSAHGSVREGRERVAAALRSAGYGLPSRRITVNLAPADVPKEGTGIDLPLAVGVLAASGHVPEGATASTAFLGELGLDGTLRPVTGVAPVAMLCATAGIGTLVLPSANAEEAAVARGVRVLGADHLAQVVDHLAGRVTLPAVRIDVEGLLPSHAPGGADLWDVRGQETVKRALEVAAAGSHNLLMIGPPGAGKTMLARRLPGLLPPLTLPEALEVTRVHSVAGRMGGAALVTVRPFRAPHHSVSYAGLVGGGRPIRPGEASLAHGGVLFLDELPEFRRPVLEVLRQPLEEGVVRLARAREAVAFPARFLLVAAMNPCPCGHHGDGGDRCRCDAGRMARYRDRVSGPLLDRIDLHVHVPAVPLEELAARPAGERSIDVAERVRRARDAQERRSGNPSAALPNGRMTVEHVRVHCRLERPVARFLQEAVHGLGLSARAYHRILKVARTVADLAGVERIATDHVAEAVQYRTLDRRLG